MSKVKVNKKKIKELKQEGEKIRLQFTGGSLPPARGNKGLFGILKDIQNLVMWILQILALFDDEEE